MEMVAIYDFRALAKVRINLKTAKYFKCSEKLNTHRRHINEETYTNVFSVVEYYISNNFVCEKHKKFRFRLYKEISF